MDKKIQTLAQLNLAYCYTIQKELPFKALLDTDTRAYYSEIELNCDVYVQYLNQYRLVDHNYTSMGRLKMFESFDDFNDRQNAIYFKAVEFDRIKSQEIQDLKQQISDLEVRKKQLNEELFAGLDASDDF